MPTAFRIRRAVRSDARDIAAVHIRSWLDTYGPGVTGWQVGQPSLSARTSTWRQRITASSQDEHLLVAVGKESLVGFLWAGPTTDADDDPQRVAQIRSIHVDPAAQGGGVGSALLDEAGVRLAASGHRLATLWVVADNASARTFYERRGWEVDGTDRRERLAMPGEDGPTVTVVRYRSRIPGC